MPEFSLFLLPLAGAYLLFIASNFFRFIQYRIERQRLLFNVILISLVLMILSTSLSELVKNFCPDLSYWILSRIPVKEEQIESSLLAFLLSPFLVLVSNWVITKEKALKYSVDLYGTDYEKLILPCTLHKKPVMISLRGGKVYVGIITKMDRLKRDHDDFITILVVLSGHRDSEFEVKWKINYFDVYYLTQRSTQMRFN